MLYLVATPLGNLEDMTFRALSTLKSVTAVYCEDTRRTRVLMSHFGISKPLLRYHEHDAQGPSGLLERLKRGEDVALVSDGGLPCLSDPGQRIVALAREDGLAVTTIPGPTAASAAVAGSGLPCDSFVFLGFLPRTPSKRKRVLAEAAALERTLVIYESPFRVLDLFEQAREVLGADAQACVARELSKVHEEWISGTLEKVQAALTSRKELLGEFVVMFHKPRKTEPPLS